MASAHSCIKLNFDGNANENHSPAGLRGLIQDSGGNTMLSFSGPGGFSLQIKQKWKFLALS